MALADVALDTFAAPILSCLKNIEKELLSVSSRIELLGTRMEYIENELRKGNKGYKNELKGRTTDNNKMKYNSIQHEACKDTTFSKETEAKVYRKPRSRSRNLSSLGDVTVVQKHIRSTYTIPSDKEERRRFDSFRRVCLSQAIKWNHVDLVNATNGNQEINLPKWLKDHEVKSIMADSNRKNQFRTFLCILREQDFETMQKWLEECKLGIDVIKSVWNAYTEFSDEDLNRRKLKCFYCRMVETVPVIDFTDHLYSADIITRELYLKSVKSKLITGAQAEIWREILAECENHVCQWTVLIAFKVTLSELGEQHEDVKRLSEELKSRKIEHFDIFECHCHEQCSRSFHPVSCLKSMSLAKVYFSPRTSTTDIFNECVTEKQNEYDQSDMHATTPKELNYDTEQSRREMETVHSEKNAEEHMYPEVKGRRNKLAMKEKKKSFESNVNIQKKVFDKSLVIHAQTVHIGNKTTQSFVQNSDDPSGDDS